MLDGLLNLLGLGLGAKNSGRRHALGWVVLLVALALVPVLPIGLIADVDLTSVPWAVGGVAAIFEARDHEGAGRRWRVGGILVGLLVAGLLMSLLPGFV